MKKDWIKYILGAVVFLFSWGLYMMTMAPTVSFWDCGEFIATSYILGVPHPPGSPLFILMGRIFSLLPTAADPALRVNLMSPLAGAAANLLVFLIIIELVRLWRGDLKSGWDKFIAYAGAFIGALAFAATDSHWFNVAEAEVYAMSTMATALVVWLIFRWARHSEEPGHERYLLGIAYIMGLAIGVHLLNLLALPVIALVIYYRKYPFKWSTFFATVAITLATFLFVYLGIIKGLPKLMSVNYLGGNVGLYLVGLVVLAVFLGAWWTVRNRRQTLAVALMSVALILVGYSSYTMIYIRANQDPEINENDPSTPARFVGYLDRAQYGSHSILDRAGVWEESKQSPAARVANTVSSPLEFLWKYQIKYMYIRYFGWQFLGKTNYTNPRLAEQVNVTKFLMLPFLLGLFGMMYHFQRDGKRALVVLTLFLMTGLAVIFYLNQPDPQPRERSYSYVGSYMAFSMWIGLGASGLLELVGESLRRKKKAFGQWVTYGLAAILLLGVPVQMVAKNYHTHNRTGNYVAWDYSYNLLQTVEPNGILFTNGDNDTFPLWYLQEVEGIRKDVKVVNLSLLNTHWYIKQLRDYQPKILPADFKDDMIDRLYPIQFKSRTVEISVPKSEKNTDGKISFQLNPTWGQALRVQDLMILRILQENLGKRPIYFAITVSEDNKINLDDFLRRDGLAQKVMTYKMANNLDPKILSENIYKKYHYRNIANPDVYLNNDIRNLLQNYRSCFLQLAMYYYQQGDKQDMRAALDRMSSTVPEKTVPFSDESAYLQIGQLYAEAGKPEVLKTRLDQVMQEQNLGVRQKLSYAWLYASVLNEDAVADSIFTQVIQGDPTNGQAVGGLLQIYEKQHRWQDAYNLVNRWLQYNPSDQSAQKLLQQYQEKLQSPDSTG